jgi:hypothetical protein
MKHFAQAAAAMIQLSKLGTRCSEIPRDHARSLYRKQIKLKERKTNIIFDAVVTDYCGEGEFGIVVSLDKKVASTLSVKQVYPAEYNSKKFVEMDLRNTQSGEYFDLVG